MNENPLRVLLVDDERSLREPLAKYLGQRFGYSVETAATAAEALACVEQAQGKYDVILLDDMLMPDQDREPERLGIKLMSQIRSAYPDAVFILFTAWGRESGLEALRAGAYRYLRKPFDPEELAAMIELAAEYQRLKGIAREKRILERLMETSAALLSDRSLPDVLDTILRGVQAIGFDRARLYLMAEDEETMVGQAQRGMEAEFKGFCLSVKDDPYVQTLLADPRPQVFERAEDHPLPYEMELAKEKVNRWACAPLMLGGKVIGKLSADNKYSDRPIEEARLQAVALFAAQAAAAIENARLMEDVSEQKDRLARLITSSPSGVISIDRNGVVTEFNAQAAAILGYQPEEVLDKRVDFLYCDPQEPLKIGRKLHEAADGKVQGYQTDVRSKAGERIPIRLAATWLYDAHGRRVGSVGYFEDLRAIDEKKKRIEFLLKASNIVARAECLTEGLDSLAEMLVTHLATTFCRILILDEQQQNLIVEAAYPHPRATGELNWQPGRGEPIALDDWPGLAPLIWEGGPTPISAEEERDRPLLRKLSRYLGLEKPIQSLLVIPLRSQTHVIGLLSLGELRSSARQSFKQEKINLAEAIAEQSAILIDRVRLLEATERSKTRLTSLYEASNQLVSSQDPERVLSDILDLVRSTAEASWVSAVLIDEIGQARQLTTSGTDKQFDVGNIIRPDGFSMQVMRTGRHVAIENCDDLRDRVNPSVFRNGVKAALCLPLSLRGRQMGVMWVHYNRPRRFPESDVEALQLYVNQAAIAYDSARRIAELERMRQAAEALAGATTIQDVLRRVVRQAQETLHADTTAF
ncbi:MAG: GAF domain-containing protein, partial [Candidatus Binatia bacterium]